MAFARDGLVVLPRTAQRWREGKGAVPCDTMGEPMGIDRLEGRLWVLLPGTLCTGAVFDAFLNVLDVPLDARKTIEIAHPNVEDYEEAMASCVGSETIVCGFSLGAIVAAHVADRLKAAQIVLFGLNPHADDPGKRDARLSLARDVSERGGAAALDARMPILKGPHPDRAREKILSMADETAHLIAAQTALALTRPGAMAALSRTRCRVTMLTGEQDQAVPPALAQEAARAAPRGRAVALRELGHYALLEDPVACARALSNAP